MPGPIPKRTEDLARPQYDANRPNRFPLTKGHSIPCNPIPPNKSWGKVAKQTYLSMTNSGMREYFQSSDWAMLYLCCDELDTMMRQRERTGKTPGMNFSTVMTQLSALGMTEGERRRMRIELVEGETEDTDNRKLVLVSLQDKLKKANKPA